MSNEVHTADLRTAADNVACARMHGIAEYLAGWEHELIRKAADEIDALRGVHTPAAGDVELREALELLRGAVQSEVVELGQWSLRFLFGGNCDKMRAASSAILAALSRPEAGGKEAAEGEGFSKEWCMKMAEMEGDAEIGAGSPDHPLRGGCPDCAEVHAIGKEWGITGHSASGVAAKLALQSLPARPGVTKGEIIHIALPILRTYPGKAESFDDATRRQARQIADAIMALIGDPS